MEQPTCSTCLHHSGTVEALRAICSKIDEREKLTNSKFEMVEKSVNLANIEMNRRLESMNEFRSQLDKQARNFMPRPEYEAKHLVLENKYGENSKAIEQLRMDTSRRLGSKQWVDYIVTVCVSTIIYVLLHLVIK